MGCGGRAEGAAPLCAAQTETLSGSSGTGISKPALLRLSVMGHLTARWVKYLSRLLSKFPRRPSALEACLENVCRRGPWCNRQTGFGKLVLMAQGQQSADTASWVVAPPLP